MLLTNRALIRNKQLTQVAFVNAGTMGSSGGGTTQTIVATPTPASIVKGNLLISVFTDRVFGTSVGVDPNLVVSPGLTGWKQLGKFVSPTSNEFGLLDVWYKWAIGSEIDMGLVTYLNAGSNVKISRMYQFANVGRIKGGGFAAGKYQASTISPVTVTADEKLSLAVSFMLGITAGTLDVYTGQTGGTWVEPVAEISTTTQNGSRLGINVATLANGGTISGGSMVGAASNVSFTFVLTP